MRGYPSRRGTLLPLLLLGAGIGCDPSAWFGGSDGEPKSKAGATAKKGSGAEADTKAEDSSAPERLEADLGTSKIGFAVAKATSEHVAVFEDFGAVATLSDGEPTRLDITIQMASLRSDREGLTKHLMSAEFFDVDKYPTAKFSASSFRPAPGDGQTHELTGKLALHGVERAITFPAEILVAKTKATGHAELTIDPRDYGIEHPALREELVDTDVLLEIQLAFPRGRD